MPQFPKDYNNNNENENNDMDNTNNNNINRQLLNQPNDMILNTPNGNIDNNNIAETNVRTPLNLLGERSSEMNRNNPQQFQSSFANTQKRFGEVISTK
jgi:hypothetical protein